MDQSRDELLFSNVKGKNPFKDKRVRQAFYQAIDIEAIKSRIMRGASTPTNLMIAPGDQGLRPGAEQAPAYDPAAAKKLLVEAGYPNGFEVGMNCPNDRYVNDASICQAVAAMLAKIDVKVEPDGGDQGHVFSEDPVAQHVVLPAGLDPGLLRRAERDLRAADDAGAPTARACSTSAATATSASTSWAHRSPASSTRPSAMR